MHSSANLTLVLLIVAIGVTPAATASTVDQWDSLQLLGREIAAGTSSKFSFIPDRSYEASYLNMPVFVARGAAPGPVLCLAAGVHGDELNGVEVARRAFAQIDPQKLHGTLIALPAINAEGVRTGNRYLSDRRDLNRAFPGRTGGSVAALIAHAIFTDVLSHCDALVDLHTASNRRANLPQIRADLSDPEIRELAIHFGLGIVVGGSGPDGSLRREAAKAGIPAIIYEAGEPFRFQEDEIARGVRGVKNIMAHLDMIERADREIPDARVYERSRWVRTAVGNSGFFFPTAKLGDIVRTGDSLGKIVDPLTDAVFEVISPIAGEIIGMAVPQPVLSGYALFNLAWHDSD
ncbi:MAG TPA: succinylglutamate desuccinylase/aspartoacylase family protein [Woeseiaceae bacterium]|nr:succinylglutamate desuccinylase/aspartoacylase family protein [Woeseiaceae bacterium]